MRTIVLNTDIKHFVILNRNASFISFSADLCLIMEQSRVCQFIPFYCDSITELTFRSFCQGKNLSFVCCHVHNS